ncbi:hypothetical protein K438DRAFT_1822171 [Mycena galopus ATCC 62051]|nr:hypothetical protein K438DRAFT_1822171 [Mycena galopus ATCC 62051]
MASPISPTSRQHAPENFHHLSLCLFWSCSATGLGKSEFKGYYQCPCSPVFVVPAPYLLRTSTFLSPCHLCPARAALLHYLDTTHRHPVPRRGAIFVRDRTIVRASSPTPLGCALRTTVLHPRPKHVPVPVSGPTYLPRLLAASSSPYLWQSCRERACASSSGVAALSAFSVTR